MNGYSYNLLLTVVGLLGMLLLTAEQTLPKKVLSATKAFFLMFSHLVKILLAGSSSLLLLLLLLPLVRSVNCNIPCNSVVFI